MCFQKNKRLGPKLIPHIFDVALSMSNDPLFLAKKASVIQFSSQLSPNKPIIDIGKTSAAMFLLRPAGIAMGRYVVPQHVHDD